MRTVQMTLDDELVAAVDRAAKRLGTSRSAFTREALRAALGKIQIRDMERKHREGYFREPVRKGEFSVWETEHAWGGLMKRGEVRWYRFAQPDRGGPCSS